MRVDWVAVWTAAGVIVAVLLAMGGGMAAWLVRIDRASQSVKHLAASVDRLEKRIDQDLHELKTEFKSEIANLWNLKSAHDLRLQDHGERLSRAEAHLNATHQRK